MKRTAEAAPSREMQSVQRIPAQGASAPVFADHSKTAESQRVRSQIAANSPQELVQRQRLEMLRDSHGSESLHSESPTMPVAQPAVKGFLAQANTDSPEQPDMSNHSNNGLPPQLKAGIEGLSGMRMDHVKVYYNSSKPAQLQAHAYAQGSEIHLAPGQERHLPHEAWHVVQQSQGRVRPNAQMQPMQGLVPVNDDAGLELEADLMGARAMQTVAHELVSAPAQSVSESKQAVAQCIRIARTKDGRWRNLSREETRDIERSELKGVDEIAEADGYFFIDSLNAGRDSLKNALGTQNYENKELLRSWNFDRYLVHDAKGDWRLPNAREEKRLDELASKEVKSMSEVNAKRAKDFYCVGINFNAEERVQLLALIAPQQSAIADLRRKLDAGDLCIARNELGEWSELSPEVVTPIREHQKSQLISLDQLEETKGKWVYIDTDDLDSEDQDKLIKLVRGANSVFEKDNFAQTLSESLSNNDMTVVKQRGGTWRELRPGEKLDKQISNLDELKTTPGPFKVVTQSLPLREKEKLIEIIAKDGSGEFARKVRNKIGKNIYTDAVSLVKDMTQLELALDALKVGIPIADIELHLQQLTAIRLKIKTDKEKQIVNATKVHGIYQLFNRLPFTLLYASKVIRNIEALQDKWDTAENRRTNRLLRFSFDESEVNLCKEEDREALVAAARSYREQKAYEKLSKGSQWTNEGLKDRVGSEVPDAHLIPALSEQNLAKLKEQTQPALEDPRMQTLYKRLMEVPYTISHATSAFNAIRNSGILSSLDNLGLWGNGQKASGMSSENNLSYKEDGDFAFFRFGVGKAPMQTRYGPTTIVANADILLEKNGWVSLHDQLVPLDRPAMQQLKDGQGQTVRTSSHDEEHTGTGKQTRWQNVYPNTGQKHEISFLDEVFYGKDITQGIALSMIREIECIGGQFKEEAFNTEGAEALGKLLISLYRVEAKLPSSFKLHEIADATVHNPAGDGRYYESGMIHPEGMAASAAYGACQRQRTLLESFIAGFKTVSKAYESNKSMVGFLKQIAAAHKSGSANSELHKMLLNAVKQTQIFVDAVKNKDVVHKTPEADRLLEISQKFLKERQAESVAVAEQKKHWESEEAQLKLAFKEFKKHQPSSFAADQQFEQRAQLFEQRLGDYAFGHPKAIEITGQLADKALQYMEKRGDLINGFKELTKELEPQDTAWAKIGEDNIGIAGAVGIQIEDVKLALKTGNVRMRMQHIYQFMNRVLGRDIQVDTTWEKLSTLIEEARLNKSELDVQRQRLKKAGKHDSLLSEADPDNLVLKQRDRIRYRVTNGENTRPIAQIGTELHELERVHLNIKEDTDRPKWHEGAKSWLIDEANSWSQTMRQMSLPLMAGPSGHTNAFMQAAQFLDVKQPYDVRLAVIGHLLPIRAHSLVEIMVAAEPFGADFVLSPQMYHLIKPLEEAELRNNVAEQQRFPDESEQ
jgi:hypothetical protein